jgi:F-type H+-transporting ATPase subunit delta
MTEAPELVPLPHASSFDQDTQRLSRVYAEALFRSAQARDEVDLVRDELEAFIRQVVPDQGLVTNFFTSGAIGRQRRAEVIEKAFRPSAGELVTNFLLVLNAHERLDLFRAIAASYFDLWEKLAGRISVQVRSAAPLAPEQQTKLRDMVQGLFHKEPVLEIGINPELLGGLTLKIGDWFYDSSVRTRLQDIRNQLIARSSYEIQSRRDRFSTDDGNQPV